jgi:hypothetical protein
VISGRALARRTVAVALVVGPLAVACSDDPTRLSASQYRTRAGEHCQTLKDASEELRRAQAPGATGRTVRKYVHGAADELRVLVQHLDDLDPPRALERRADRLVELLAGYADGLDTLATRVGPDDTLTATFQKHQQLVQRLNHDAADATALVTRLGLTDCLLS